LLLLLLLLLLRELVAEDSPAFDEEEEEDDTLLSVIGCDTEFLASSSGLGRFDERLLEARMAGDTCAVLCCCFMPSG
jgi:hypothetical protein